MRVGDLLQEIRTTRAGVRFRRSNLIGILLEEPTFPTYGNFPRRFKVLTPGGVIKELVEEHLTVIEAVG